MQLEHELIQKTATLPFNVFTFRARDTSRVIPQHWHQSTELIDCLDGSLDVWIEGTHYRMHKGDMILINPNTVHSTRSLTVNHILVIQIPLAYLEQLTDNQFLNKFQFDLNTLKSPNSNSEAVRSCLIKLATVYERSNQNWSLATRIKEQALLLTAIAELLERHTELPRRSRSSSHSESLDLMNQITHYISKHADKQLSLHQTARYFNYSDSYFSRIFKHGFNMNFHDFVISVRLNEAVSRLLTSNQTINDIALASGFDTYRNFYNAFYGVYQASPSEYRQNFRQNSTV